MTLILLGQAKIHNIWSLFSFFNLIIIKLDIHEVGADTSIAFIEDRFSTVSLAVIFRLCN
jgi:hypothetical protein